MLGWPYTRIAAAPFPAPVAYSRTRLLTLSATNRSPFGPMATPPGLFNELAVTSAEIELLKSSCPITAFGRIRPLCATGRGYRSTRLFPLSATYNVPSDWLTAMPSGAKSPVCVGFGDPWESTFAAPVRRFG